MAKTLSALLVLTISLAAALSAEANSKGLRYSSDVPQATRIQLEADLEHFFTMSSSNPSALYQEIFGSFDRKSSENWFYSRVKDVGINLCTEESAVACVLSAWENWIFLSPNYTEFQHPSIARLMVLFHEARHTESENRNWPHAKCPKPFLDEKGAPVKSIWTGASLAGEMACDLEEYGSYGTATILLLNVAYRCENCSDEDKHDALVYGMDQLRRITWKPAQDRIRQDLGIPPL